MKHAVTAGPIKHGAAEVSSVIVDTYNVELRSEDGFLGDRASKRAFDTILEEWRERMRKLDADPLGAQPADQISKKKLDRLLGGDDLEAAALVHGVVEEFARELAVVVRRFLRLKSWEGTQHIAVGGGLRASRVGELAIARALVLLKADGHDVRLAPIRHHPDEAGLIGCAHLAPAWMFGGHDSLLAVDVGGTNIRAGIIELDLKKDPVQLRNARVGAMELWRHRDDSPTREEAVNRLGRMLRELAKQAGKDKRRLAPFVGVGCPGLIGEDGTIQRGGQNLPGNWESRRFHLPTRIRQALPAIGGNETIVVMHNDAVVHGLSESPFIEGVERWGVLTIGTGLGNARFTKRQVGSANDKERTATA